jgi:cobyrinic acid a,c-diamide synthase
VVFFSPLADAAVPPCDALWLPGGYPELHIAALAGNRAMRDSLASHVAAGRPVWAECGGMMALFDELVTVDGESHPAWGLLPGRVIMQERLAALGPQQLAMGAHSLRGHTFHHSTCVTALPPLARTLRPEGQTVPAASEALYRLGSVRASYFHAWFASSPEATAGLFQTGDRV